MEKKLLFRDYLTIGSMLFGLFFGAGNLIFPVHLGQEAGANVTAANFGLLVTGVGLPFLGVIAMGLSQSSGVFELSSRVNKPYAYIFTILLYLVIGPFFALPRLATTSYEIGIAPHIPNDQQSLVLAVFSILFFVTAWWFSRKPSKILDYVGKFLNPVFLVLLAILLILAFANPLGDVANAPVQASYQSGAFSGGFIEGYNTLDALASLAFGILIIEAIKNRGIKDPSTVAVDTIKSGTISIILMGIIYSLLSYMGTMSLGGFSVSENGGVALAQLSQHYLGTYGSIILALIVIVACLKTGIGLITSFSETFSELFPKGKYMFFTILVSAMACLFANVGLTKIIELATPVLMFLYPLAMTLIILAIIGRLFNNDPRVYQITTLFTLVASIIDGLNAAPAVVSQTGFAQTLIQLGEQYFPLFAIGMGWVLPALIGFIVSLIWYAINKNKHA
ncbi:branched-chain amino acid transport system carrier protein [Tetragenococcus halophilus subsp. flandriensis]|uniref:branched-chain amino acid transport system II carrier protein n=1 Tax=Tetragenococcus halophilus TaxID=51669 RepID=UPI0023E95E25|nr:branched-chain amino acid transport system II carrier protein [Tetragenococcus halophilus]GMA07171.1 branched-chain amino acid transport system carrier protein [Tetragenococcus halophilus subsp. flandriensis]